MLKRLIDSYGRLMGLLVAGLGGWIAVSNLGEGSYMGGTLAWILVSGVFGAVGGVVYLLSFDGPDRFRTPSVRRLAWLGMLVMALLPWSFQFVLLPMLLLTLPTLSKFS
ncbi:MAG TPA: hypothetical protein VJR05_11465 [Acidimicrobiia bacterium]|nr:hypothetical protein [Acidimicrobiia bacterium]